MKTTGAPEPPAPFDRSLDPSDWPAVRARGHRMLDDIFDYLERIRERPVWQPIPDHVRARFRQDVPAAPADLAAVHDEFMSHILPFATGNAHPGFMGWVHGGGNVPGMLAEMLAAGLNANLGGRDHMPIEVERQIAHWMRQIFGFPGDASGLFVTGSSMANLIGVLVARAGALGVAARRKGVAAGDKRLTAYASAAAHDCIAQAMDLSGLGVDALRVIATNDRHQIDVEALQAEISKDRISGFTPFLVVGSAGTVDIGAIDDLAKLADVAAREKLWFHVDGAFGALAILAPDLAPRLAGIERADSIALDFHKWAQVPYDAGFILVRDATLHQATFASPAAYLRREARGLAAGSAWPCDFGPDLSRGFRALKTWFTLKVHGTAAIGAMISHTCELARRLEGRIAATPELELLAPVGLNIVCFRYRGDDADALNAGIVADLHESGICAPSTTRIDGRLAIRAAIFNHRTERRDIDALVDAVLMFGRAAAGGHGKVKPVPMITDVIATSPASELPVVPIGRPTLVKMSFDGADLMPVWDMLIECATIDPRDAAALMDMATIAHIAGHSDDRAALQDAALKLRRVYRQLPASGAPDGIRLLAFMVAGNFLANTPVEFMLEGSNVTLDMVYVTPGRPLPPLPEHDVALVAVTELTENQAALRDIAALLPTWPRPVLNAPDRIERLTRDGAWQLLKSVPGAVIPITARMDRQQLERIARDDAPVADMLDGRSFPIIARPLDSHAGEGLQKLDDAAAIHGYLRQQPEQEFFVAPFMDYRGRDGMFRKYRIALIEGHPYACHMGISEHWMIHYVNADMYTRAERRAEEARFMADFECDFAVRHAIALNAIARQIDLDYVTMDCAETPDGKLLIFEVGNGMIVHAMDPPELFPYKKTQMDKVFRAFENMLRNASKTGGARASRAA